MSFLADLESGGIWPLQHHDKDYSGPDIGIRSVRMAARIVKRDQFGRYSFEDRVDGDTVGDVNCAAFWPRESPNRRALPGWAFAWPSVVTADVDLETEKLKVRPIRRDDYEPDDRFKEMEVKPPPQVSNLSPGTIGITLAGVEEMSQQSLFLPIGVPSALVAAHLPADDAGGDGTWSAAQMGSKVFDLTVKTDPDTGEESYAVDDHNFARLQTAWRVGQLTDWRFKKPAPQFGPDDENGFLAWNMTATGHLGTRQHSMGFGSIVVMEGPKLSVTGTGAGTVNAVHVVGVSTHEVGGPLCAGSKLDKHRIGTVKIGEDDRDLLATHLSVGTIFRANDREDAPIAFTDARVKNVGTPTDQAFTGNYWWWGYLTYVDGDQHGFGDEARPGAWHVAVKLYDITGPGVSTPPRHFNRPLLSASLPNQYGGTASGVPKNRKYSPWQPGQHNVTTVYRTVAAGFSAIYGRASSLNERDADIRFSREPAAEDVERFLERAPVTFYAEPFAAQGGRDGAGVVYGESTGYRYTQTRFDSKWGAPTANGGLAIIPPELDLIDLKQETSRTAYPTSDVHWIMTPGTYWAAGRPDFIHGRTSKGYRWGDDVNEAGSLVFHQANDVTTAAQAFTDQFRMRSTETVHNEASNDIDFRAESNTDAFGLYLDAGNGIVGIGIDTDYGGSPGWGPSATEPGSLDIEANFHAAGMADVGKEFQTRALSPSQITSNQNDYNPGRGSFFRLSTDASRTITGFATGHAVVADRNGQHLPIVNVGSFDLVLAHQSASSTASNRIITDTGADLTIGAGKAAFLLYDATTERWRVLWRSPGGGAAYSMSTISGVTTISTLTNHSLFACSSASYTITLPTAASSTGFILILKRTSTGAVITIDGDGAETIDGSATVTLNSQYDSETLISDGTSWHRV